MKITKRQLKRIIRESLPYRKGQSWVDPKAPVGVDRTEDDLDRELTDEEIEASMGMERATPFGDSEFFLGILWLISTLVKIGKTPMCFAAVDIIFSDKAKETIYFLSSSFKKL